MDTVDVKPIIVDGLPFDPLRQYQCKVCSAHATGFHFDAQSCSACAAFFRRTVALGKVFRCQNGDNKCEIVYTERNLCRKCRFDKCLLIGMKKESVRPKKTVNAVRAYCTTSGLKRNKRFATVSVINMAPSIKSPLSAPSSQSTSEPVSESEECQSVQPIVAPSSSTSPTRSVVEYAPMSHAFYRPAPSTLKLLIEEEMRISERRRILFCERPVGSLLGASNSCPFMQADIKPLCFRSFRKSIRTHILLIYEWLRAWPEYSMLGNNDQIALLRKCVLYHTVLDPCFITMQLGDMSKFVMPNGGYVSTREDCDDGWQDEKEISRESKKMIYWPLLDGLMSTIVQPMIDMAITFEEFVALKALVSFQGTMCDISDDGRPIMKHTLDAICRSLHEIVPDGDKKAMRFGNIVLLLSPVFDTALNFVESHHKVHFFDLWHLDSLLLQFLKNKV
uniref:Nuclear receptor domain-containing protein n=1 Tax=Panagrellus redivivus TaxID=6233 RepID=A0A7E4VGA1_PANRE